MFSQGIALTAQLATVVFTQALLRPTCSEPPMQAKLLEEMGGAFQELHAALRQIELCQTCNEFAELVDSFFGFIKKSLFLHGRMLTVNEELSLDKVQDYCNISAEIQQMKADSASWMFPKLGFTHTCFPQTVDNF